MESPETLAPERRRKRNFVPRLKPETIHRERLLTTLGRRHARIAAVLAPAGFGKTTLVLDWLKRAGCPHAWVALGAEDNAPHAFFAHLALASDPEAPMARLKHALEAAASLPARALLEALLDDLYEQEKDVALVFDDYHHIQALEIHRCMAELIEEAPPRLRLVVLSRVDPPFPLARRRLSGELVEIRERDLRFTPEEARLLLEQALGREVDPATVQALESRTEGWAAGLQMAAISMAGDADPAGFVRRFSGGHTLIVDYLIEEVVRRQPAEMQEFLMRTALLPRFNAPLCAYAAQMPEASALLARADRANLFLVSLDDEGEWFRYHHLFAELLALRFRRLHPAEWEATHERAGRWFEQEGDLDAAFHHAACTPHQPRLLLLLERYSHDMLDRSEVAALARYVSMAPADQGAGYPAYLSARAWLMVLQKRYADAAPLIARAQQAIENPVPAYTQAELEGLRCNVATLQAFAARFQGRFEYSIRLSLEILPSPGAQSLHNQGMLLFNLGQCYAQLGRLAEAFEAHERAYGCNRRGGDHYLSLYGAGQLGMLIGRRDGLHHARQYLETAMAVAESEGLAAYPAAGSICFFLGVVCYLQDELPEAEQHFRDAIERSGLSVPDAAGNAWLALAQLAASCGRTDEALDALRQAEILEHTSDVTFFLSTTGTERARLAFYQSDRDFLRRWAEEHRDLAAPFAAVSESAALLRAQVLIALGDYPGAAEILDRLHEDAHTHGRSLTLLHIQIGRALLEAAQGRRFAAVDRLQAALEGAAPQRLIRPFVEAGEMLRALLLQALNASLPAPLAEFARAILGAASPRAAARRTPMFRQPLSRPLTEREQEVLYHLSRGLSNPRIADTLFVSLDTVKTHLKRVYSKLGAAGRREAIEKARSLGLPLAE